MSDRIARAGDYVLGLMNDAERERAERDLEIDPAFRDAVLQLAERMHMCKYTLFQPVFLDKPTPLVPEDARRMSFVDNELRVILFC